MENDIKTSYEMKDLIETFQKHHDLRLQQEKELDEKYPNRESKNLPQYDFCISLALKSMCEELINLRYWISDIEDQIDNHMRVHE